MRGFGFIEGYKFISFFVIKCNFCKMKFEKNVDDCGEMYVYNCWKLLKGFIVLNMVVMIVIYEYIVFVVLYREIVNF